MISAKNNLKRLLFHSWISKFSVTINTTTRTKPHDVINSMNDTQIFLKIWTNKTIKVYKVYKKGRISHWNTIKKPIFSHNIIKKKSIYSRSKTKKDRQRKHNINKERKKKLNKTQKYDKMREKNEEKKIRNCLRTIHIKIWE